MAELGNVFPAISVEGYEKETDERRGTEVYKNLNKMKTVKLSVLGTALFLLTGFSANAQDASAILKKMDDVMYSPKDKRC